MAKHGEGKMKNCYKCGKEMEDKNGELVIGMLIRVSTDSQKPEREKFLKEQLGPYEPNRDYIICYECLLRSIFGGAK